MIAKALLNFLLTKIACHLCRFTKLCVDQKLCTELALPCDETIHLVAVVKWLWEETHAEKVVSLIPGTIYWMDIFHIYLQ